MTNRFIIYTFIHEFQIKTCLNLVFLLPLPPMNEPFINLLNGHFQLKPKLFLLRSCRVWGLVNKKLIQNIQLRFRKWSSNSERSKQVLKNRRVRYLRLFLLLLNQMLTWLIVIPSCSLNMDFWVLFGYLEMFWKKSFIVFNCSSVKPVRMPKFANKHELAAWEGGKKFYQ